MIKKNKDTICECLVEDCENLAEVVDFVCKNGIDVLTSDGKLISGYDLIVKYYAGILVGLGSLLSDFEVTIPDESLQKAMEYRAKEIKDEI